MTSFSEPPAANTSAFDKQRARPRDSLFLTARLRFVDLGDDFIDVRVRNLSEGGMMIDLADGVDITTIVELDVRGLGLIRGRVAWCAEGRAGIALDKPIDPQKARKPVGQGGHTPSYTKAIIARVR